MSQKLHVNNEQISSICSLNNSRVERMMSGDHEKAIYGAVGPI